jgi:hypothetical protein
VNLIIKRVFGRAGNSSSINNREWIVTEPAISDEPISGDARLIVNDRDSTLDQAIKEGRFADIWASNDSYG